MRMSFGGIIGIITSDIALESLGKITNYPNHINRCAGQGLGIETSGMLTNCYDLLFIREHEFKIIRRFLSV
jgi:hypothetical protein